MQSLHSAITPPAPPAPRQLPNFPTSRQVDKLASWQVGKHRHLPLHHQPVPAAFLLHPADPAALACSRSAAKPPTLLPAALLFLLRPACHPYPRVNRPPATLAHPLPLSPPEPRIAAKPPTSCALAPRRTTAPTPAPRPPCIRSHQPPARTQQRGSPSPAYRG